MRKQGERVRIVAELINAADGIELWTRTFDRELKDIFAVQQEIADGSGFVAEDDVARSGSTAIPNPTTQEYRSAQRLSC